MPACQACICPPWQPCLLSLESPGAAQRYLVLSCCRIESLPAQPVAA